MSLEIFDINLDEVILDPENARKHSPENIRAIRGSLTAFGQRKPVVLTSENIVIAGNGTVTAAKELEWQTISAVKVPADWSVEKVKAFALADNKTAELAKWDSQVLQMQALELQGDFDLAEFGFTDEDLSVFDVTEIEPPDLADGERGEFEQITFTLHTSQAELIRDALAEAKLMEELDSEVNNNTNANAITKIAERYMDGER